MKMVNESVKKFTETSDEYLKLVTKSCIGEDSFRDMNEEDFSMIKASFDLVDVYSKMLSDLADILDEQTIMLEEIRTILKEAKDETK